MDLTWLVGILVGLGVAWPAFILLLRRLRRGDARLRDLLRIVHDIVCLVCRRVATEELRTRWRGTPEGFALLEAVLG